MKRYIFILSVLCSLLLSALSVKAQAYSKFYFTHINGENGLSASNVKTILQDSYGFMWFGTKNGLNRYDGTSVLQLNCDEPHGGMTVYQIKEDRLLPHITFRLGTHTPIDMNKEMDLFNKTNNNQWIISRVYESNRHIYFSYTAEQKYYWGYYDKMNKKTYIGIGIPQKAYERGVQFPLFYNGIKALTYQKQGNSIKVRIGELL